MLNKSIFFKIKSKKSIYIAFIAAFAFMVAEAMRLKMKYWYLYFVGTFGISFAFSFGLFMFNRERNLMRLSDQSS